MTRVLVQRGSGSSSSQNRTGAGSSASTSATRPDTQGNTGQVVVVPKDEDIGDEVKEQIVDAFVESSGSGDNKVTRTDEPVMESVPGEGSESLDEEIGDCENLGNEEVESSEGLVEALGRLRIESEDSSADSPAIGGRRLQPPPPPVPPPKPTASNTNLRRFASGSSNSSQKGSPRRAVAWSVVSSRTSPTGSRPSSPRSHGESEGYNSADEQNSCFVSSYDDVERERQFEIDLRRSKGLEVKRMVEDGNCFFRAVADQVYGDSEMYDLVRQMCMDYMERERDHFSQFITEGFTSYCKRKRRDKVYGNNVEIQALSEMYNRPIHIYSYSTDPINIFHGSYNPDIPPIRVSYHHGNHYNSLVNPRRLTLGAGLGFSCLQGSNIDREQIKAAIKAQQDQQIDNALLSEGQFYSDIELTEKEIERMVMEASRAEYLANDRLKQQLGHKESSTSAAEPSSSGARSSGSETKVDGVRDNDGIQETALSGSMQMVLSMGFSYLQVTEAYSIFGEDVDSMVCYLLETGNGSRRKGKATE